MNQTNWQGMLDDCRERFGNSPRDFGSAELQHLKVAFSWLTRWVSRSDALCQPLAAQKKLFRTGTVVWGCVIQANMGLFEPGQQDLPGEMVYSLAPDDTTPDILTQ
ncbi:hypothetical protein, partial [Rhodopirellula sallentina]|uniref:hypothetical protein n=1 Tax=Rhodopirellula sallentina TaxID=1263869 RepID=UPI0005C7DAF2